MYLKECQHNTFILIIFEKIEKTAPKVKTLGGWYIKVQGQHTL